MKSDLTELDRFRISDRGENPGTYEIPFREGVALRVMASELYGWDHVSVLALQVVKKHGKFRVQQRPPTREEASDIRRRFFDDDEIVVSYVPVDAGKKNFVHLWRSNEHPMPYPDGCGATPRGD